MITRFDLLLEKIDAWNVLCSSNQVCEISLTYVYIGPECFTQLLLIRQTRASNAWVEEHEVVPFLSRASCTHTIPFTTIRSSYGGGTLVRARSPASSFNFSDVKTWRKKSTLAIRMHL
jgi:hypothetical protein